MGKRKKKTYYSSLVNKPRRNILWREKVTLLYTFALCQCESCPHAHCGVSRQEQDQRPKIDHHSVIQSQHGLSEEHLNNPLHSYTNIHSLSLSRLLTHQGFITSQNFTHSDIFWFLESSAFLTWSRGDLRRYIIQYYISSITPTMLSKRTQVQSGFKLYPSQPEKNQRVNFKYTKVYKRKGHRDKRVLSLFFNLALSL